MGRLQTFSPQMSRKNKYFPPSGKTSNLFASNVKKKQVFPDRQKDFLFFNSAVLNCAVESVPTRRTTCKFLTKLGEMPSPRPIISIHLNGKEGLPLPLNKCSPTKGYVSENRFWFVLSALILSLLAPLFRRMRATFSQSYFYNL